MEPMAEQSPVPPQKSKNPMNFSNPSLPVFSAIKKFPSGGRQHPRKHLNPQSQLEQRSPFQVPPCPLPQPWPSPSPHPSPLPSPLPILNAFSDWKSHPNTKK